MENETRRVISTSVPEKVSDQLKELAAKEKRSLTRQVELILTQYVLEALSGDH